MKSKVSTIAIAVVLGLAAGAGMAGDKTGNAPGGTGVEQSTESMGATDKQGDTKPMGEMKGSPNSSDEGGTGIKGSAEGKGATNKSTEDMGAPMGSKSGMSTGNAPGGTGVEQSTEGQGAMHKNRDIGSGRLIVSAIGAVTMDRETFG